jgi:hypothetical protein
MLVSVKLARMIIFRFTFIAVLALASCFLALCEASPSAVDALAQRITATDRIIVTNWAAAGFGEQPFSIAVPGDKVQGIVRAVSAAAFYSNQEHPNWEWGWQLRFYRGTNLLAAIYFAGDTFLADGVYRDPTGALERVYRDSSNREYAARVYKDDDKDFAASKKAEAKAWLKSPLHTVVGQDKKKVLRYVNDFYGAGALKVFVTDIETHVNGKNLAAESARYLCVVLPADEEARSRVFRVHREAVREWGFDADNDVGQKYTWYPMDWHDLK